MAVRRHRRLNFQVLRKHRWILVPAIPSPQCGVGVAVFRVTIDKVKQQTHHEGTADIAVIAKPHLSRRQWSQRGEKVREACRALHLFLSGKVFTHSLTLRKEKRTRNRQRSRQQTHGQTTTTALFFLWQEERRPKLCPLFF